MTPDTQNVQVERVALGEVQFPDWHPRFHEGTCPVFGYVIRHPDGGSPDSAFDVAVVGNASAARPDPEPKNVDLAGLAEAGATWWMESLISFDPLDMSLDVVDAGPPGT